jgi:hypothetical protein
MHYTRPSRGFVTYFGLKAVLRIADLPRSLRLRRSSFEMPSPLASTQPQHT